MRPIEILFVTLSVLVIVLVGFAPLFPAEFVVIQIQQIQLQV